MNVAGSVTVLVLGLLSGAPPCERVEAQAPASSKPQATHAPYIFHGNFLKHVIETEPFQTAMPLGKFLQALEKRLPKEEKISLRIDAEAFGDKAAEVAATLIKLPAHPAYMTLATALRMAGDKVKTKIDYRLGVSEYVITTPQRALYTAVHDIRDIIQRPQTLTLFPSFKKNVALRNLDESQRAALVIQAIFSSITDPYADKETASPPEDIQVLNGTRLVVRTNALRHRHIDTMLQAFRRFGDMTVIVNTRLYEVDQDFYTKLKNIKPISLEEEELIFRGEGKGKSSPWGPIYKLLSKQKRFQEGDELTLADGQKAVLLSRQKVLTCLPSAQQIRQGEKGRQTIPLGVSFVGEVQISPDRRYVRVELTEKDTELQEIKKTKVWLPSDPEKDVDAEIPFLRETTHARVLEIPDGGSILVPVHARTPDLSKDRFWVLSIMPRIRIEEEERMIQKMSLGEMVPALVADILKNPRLKSHREFYGFPGDKRFALLDSPVWTWTKEDRPKVAGYQWTPAKRAGKPLLGIRIDKYEMEKDAITVALVNAGGSDNGPAIGAGTIRYNTRSTDKGWRVELVENVAP